MTQTSLQAAPIRWTYSVLWTVVLAALCIGASVNFALLSHDLVQPYCATEPSEYYSMCKPCGLRWGMFGIVDPTQCPNSIVDELLNIFVATPRFLFITFGMAFFLSVPALVSNFLVLRSRRASGDRTILNTAQLWMLGYLLLWGLATLAFFALSAFG